MESFILRNFKELVKLGVFKVVQLAKREKRYILSERYKREKR